MTKYNEHYHYIYTNHSRMDAELKARDSRGVFVYGGDVHFDKRAGGYVALLATEYNPETDSDVRWLGTCAAFGDAIDLLWAHRHEAHVPERVM